MTSIYEFDAAELLEKTNKILIEKHGINWIAGDKKVVCPECKESDYTYDIITDTFYSEKISQNILAYCANIECEKCGCNFKIIRAEQAE